MAKVRKAVDPIIDGSGGWRAPELNYGLRFSDYGSYGLRQHVHRVRDAQLSQKPRSGRLRQSRFPL
jgi:hypothetical protein